MPVVSYLGPGLSYLLTGSLVVEQIFGLPVSLAQTNSIGGLKSALDQPEFASAIGLVKFGSFQRRNRARRGGLGAIKSKVNQLLRAVRK